MFVRYEIGLGASMTCTEFRPLSFVVYEAENAIHRQTDAHAYTHTDMNVIALVRFLHGKAKIATWHFCN